ncbi:MAG: thioredoxin family protein [Planctomycetota bacterium]|nr:thioredoxin family protein [Planctomycetota bacterium]
MSPRNLQVSSVVVIASVAFATVALATVSFATRVEGAPAERSGGILEQLGSFDQVGNAQPGGEIKVSAHLRSTADNEGILDVIAELAPDWHIYSVTQKPGGPRRTEIILEPSNDYQLTGTFTPDQPPRVYELKDIYDIPLEDHAKRVIWSAGFRLNPGANLDAVEIRGHLVGQVCQEGGQCIPLSELETTFVARLHENGGQGSQLASRVPASTAESAAPPNVGPRTTAGAREGNGAAVGSLLATAPYRASAMHATWQGWVDAQGVQPGDWITVYFRAVPDAGYHVYAYEPSDAKAISYKPTIVGLANAWPSTEMEPDNPPIEKELLGQLQRYYEGPVVWSFCVQVPESISAGAQELRGSLGYQTCTSQSCDPPAGLDWRVTIPVGSQPEGSMSLGSFLSDGSLSDGGAVEFSDSSYGAAIKLARTTSWIKSKGGANSGPGTGSLAQANVGLWELLKNIGIGLFGGLILNLMPCVLPVIGLKVLSFVEQAGQNRWRIFVLNIVYSAGIIAVFLVLATLVAFAKFNWGEQYNNPSFVIGMAGLVFVMALSFLGVWEIPIPGFSGGSSKIASQEGFQGAFVKGVITTILATPCSGPYLGLVLAYAFGKPPYVAYLVFGSIGLGMSLPYLIIGARPELVRSLPRPGVWMETFKQFLGFVMLGAVVYLFSTISNPHLLVPTLGLLFSLWFGCWLVGRIPSTASADQRARSWLVAAASVVFLGYFSFQVLGNYSQVVESDVFVRGKPFVAVKDGKILWRNYSKQLRQEASAAGKTVMVEFTASWCLTCKSNLLWAIETESVRNLLQENQVVPLLADWKDENNAEIKEALKELGSISVPLLAIYSADDPLHPIILRDLITKNQLVVNLRKAGASQTGYATASKESRP